MLTATFLLIHFVAKYDPTIDPPIEDETSHAFDDWFADAYKYVDEDGYIRDSRYPDGDPEGNMKDMDTEKHLIGEEMSTTLRNVYGEQKNVDADANYGNDHHFGEENVKSMGKVFHSESRVT